MAEETLTRSAALSKASSTAFNRLKEAHLDEWNGYMAAAAHELGERWTPRLTPEQRAEQELARLLADNPSLRAKIEQGAV